jgi:hypothetical protein
VEEADRRLLGNDQWREELAEWVHPNEGNDVDGMTGDAFGIPGPLSAFAPWLVRNFDLGDARGKQDRMLAEDAAGLIVVTGDDDPASLIRAGETLERLLLVFTSLGVQYAFLNQPVQIPSSGASSGASSAPPPAPTAPAHRLRAQSAPGDAPPPHRLRHGLSRVGVRPQSDFSGIIRSPHAGRDRVSSFSSHHAESMARPLRLEREGALWHITSRGVEKRDIYLRSQRSILFSSTSARPSSCPMALHAYVL